MSLNFFSRLRTKLSMENSIILLLVVINVLPILAPIFMHWGWVLPAKAIYFIYSFTCHQIHWRSLHLHDHQCAWCARDMAIWAGVLFTVVLLKTLKIKGLKWYQVLPFVIPIALDGGIQTVATMFSVNNNEPLYVSTSLMRAISGGVFGIGIGGFVWTLITGINEQQLKDKVAVLKGRLQLDILRVAGSVFALVIALYFVFVLLWNFSSTNYKPSNILDSAVKLPKTEQVVLIRRENAICPVELDPSTGSSTDPFAFECFLGKK